MTDHYIAYVPGETNPVSCGSAIWKVDWKKSAIELLRPWGGFPISPSANPVEQIKTDEPPEAAVRRVMAAALGPSIPFAVERLPCAPGEYFHRIARPVMGVFPAFPTLANWDDHGLLVRSQMGGQLDWLLEQLRSICQTVHPSRETFSTFGHEIRNLLILACTEVEAAWKGIFVANGASPTRRFTTKDYVKICPVLKLQDYSVAFSPYPWLDRIRPFANWTAAAASKSLPWYDAYNQTKHDRERRFSDATLQHAFHAISACVILLHAQFGNLAESRAGQIVNIIDQPTWTFGDCYVPGNQVGLSTGPTAICYVF